MDYYRYDVPAYKDVVYNDPQPRYGAKRYDAPPPKAPGYDYKQPAEARELKATEYSTYNAPGFEALAYLPKYSEYRTAPAYEPKYAPSSYVAPRAVPPREHRKPY